MQQRRREGSREEWLSFLFTRTATHAEVCTWEMWQPCWLSRDILLALLGLLARLHVILSSLLRGLLFPLVSLVAGTGAVHTEDVDCPLCFPHLCTMRQMCQGHYQARETYYLILGQRFAVIAPWMSDFFVYKSINNRFSWTIRSICWWQH